MRVLLNGLVLFFGLIIFLVPVSVDGGIPPDYDCSQEEGLVPMEDFFGVANVNGISGNGGLSAGFAEEGELTLVRWPSPSYFDQICYLTPFLSPSCESRQSPYHGAEENMGSFAGLHYRALGELPRMSWFRDEPWTHSQHYVSDRSNVLVTRAVNADLGLTVEAFDFVMPERDVLVRHYKITRSPGSPMEEAAFIYFENLEPAVTKIPYFPVADSLLDPYNDFAVLYSSELDALIHFRPQERNYDALPQPDAPQSEIDRFVERLDETFPFDPARSEEPVCIAVGADFGLDASGRPARSDGHQCGSQRHTLPGPVKAQGAFYDALDGRLSNVSAASGLVSAALAKAIEPGFEAAEFTVYLAFAGTASEALFLLEDSRARGFDANFEETERFWADWLSRAALPDTDDPLILATARRTLITMRNYFDKRTGAFVASITTQPPYNVNWPRDGVYFAYLADVAGFPEIAEANMRFQARVQRDCRDRSAPNYDLFCAMEPYFRLEHGWYLDGTFDMAYYADGVHGGPIFFEIDNSGFAAWMMWEHYRFLDPEDGVRYLCSEEEDGTGSIYEAIRRTGDSLGRCRTPGDESGLQCYAFEDDNIELRQTLTGAITVYMAVSSAIQAGTVCGEDQEVIDRWIERLEELSCAIDANFWDEGAGRYKHGHAGAYLLWPANFPLEADRLDSQSRYLFETMVPTLTKEAEGSAYAPKVTLALAKRGWDTGEPGRDLDWAIRIFNRDLPAQDTRHYGEGVIIADIDGDGVKDYDNRVAIPHLWEATLNYLSAAAFYGTREPEQTGEEEALEHGDHCGCSVVGGGGHRSAEEPEGSRGQGPGSMGANLVLVLLPMVLIVLKKKRM